MRLAARMKLLFIAAINHVYGCNSWRPTWSHNPTEVCCDWLYGYREDTFAKGHLYFMTEFTASARETDVAVCWELLWWQELPASPSRLSPSNEAVTNRMRPFSTALPPVRAVGKETVAVCHGEQVLFLSLGMKASSLVTRTQISSCHRLQAAVLAVQMGLLKILWPLKDICICLLLYLFVYWAWVFLSALVHLTYPMGEN